MSDWSGLMDSITKDEFWELLLGQREFCFQHCDRLTRKHGRLAKWTMIMDMTRSSLASMMNRRVLAMQSEVSKIASNVYPQMQEKLCYVNAPS
jgi:hypothetical protein